MKGVVLAGGLGTRLLPLTKVINKHLLPLYDRPMIYYSIDFLIKSGVDDLLIVTGRKDKEDFLQVLNHREDLGLKELKYAYQEGEDGIASALLLAEIFANGEPIAVLLGDNIFENSFANILQSFSNKQSGAHIFLKQTDHLEYFGVPSFHNGRLGLIEEKPLYPPSVYAVTGFYLYPSDVFEVIRHIKPSQRGEIEITDVNNHYIKNDKMSFDIIDGVWIDAGTFESLHRANVWMRELTSKTQ